MKNKKIGVSFSGGGFRAAAFHLGTLNKLNELGILKEISVLSTVSGGSITGAYYCLNKSAYETFRDELYSKLLNANIISYAIFSVRFVVFIVYILCIILFPIILLHWGHPVIAILVFLIMWLVLFRFQFTIFPVSSIIEKAYDKYFFQKKTLGDLNNGIEVVINSTNLETGRLFSFSKRKIGDSTYTHMSDGRPAISFKTEDFPISKAVMASTCVPHAFSPVEIGKKYFNNEGDVVRCRPLLIDGGIYDNQGIHKITHRGSSFECDIIITSDAGTGLPFLKGCNNTFNLLVRTVDLFMQRIKHFQLMNNVYRNVQHGINKEIAYYSLGWDLEKCIPGFVENLINKTISNEVIGLHKIPNELLRDICRNEYEISEILKKNVGFENILSRRLSKDELNTIRKIGTNLCPFGREKLDKLIQHAENLTELQIKLYCPSLFI